MKKFDFRLNRVLHWREIQKQLQEERTRKALAQAVQAREEAGKLIAQGTAAAAQVQLGGEASLLGTYPAFTKRLDQEKQAALAEIQRLDAAAAKERKRLLELHRGVELLTRLHDTRLAEWTAQNEREMQQFAEEAFVGRLRTRGEHRGA